MSEWIEIGAGRAYRAGAAAGKPVLLLHAWWGLNQSIVELADRLASDGFLVLAPDVFDGVVLDTIESADAHLAEIEDEESSERILEEMSRALDRLLETSGKGSASVIGLSFGAFYGSLLAKRRGEVEALVMFYGGGWEVPRGPDGDPVPFLGHFATDDPYEDPAEVAPFHSKLVDADPRCAAFLYEGTSHWFCEPDRPEYDPEQARLAYDRTVEFLRG